MSDYSGICIVGYALNAKKLRKSSKCEVIKEITHINNETNINIKPSTMIINPLNRCNPIDNCTSTDILNNLNDSIMEWHGGGLADILLVNTNSNNQITSTTNNNIVQITADNIVQFIPWDYEIPIENQTKFHVIIHKLTEDIDKLDKESIDKMKALESYLQTYTDTVIIDSIDAVRKVINREKTCIYLTNIQSKLQGKCPFTIPNYMIINRSTTASQSIDDIIMEKFITQHLEFPVICKPLVACGTPDSHSMVVIVRKEDLYMLQDDREYIVQQYHNHSGTFFKVYVIDEDVMVFQRPSLPNLHCNNNPPYQHYLKSLVFDSRNNYPNINDFYHNCSNKINHNNDHSNSTNNNSTNNNSNNNNNIEISQSLCREAANAIRQEFGLTLFGFDVIIPQQQQQCFYEEYKNNNQITNNNINNNNINDNSMNNSNNSRYNNSSNNDNTKMMIIDINYFPSYKEVKDFPIRLKAYLRKQMKTKSI